MSERLTEPLRDCSGLTVLLLVGDFVEDYEAMVPLQALQAIGVQVHAATPGKARGEKVVTAIHDFRNFGTYTETRGHDFELNATFEEIQIETLDAIIIPGGRAAEYLRMNAAVLALVERLNADGRIIGALCHGVQLLTATSVLRGRRATAYPAMRPEVEGAGALWIDPGKDGVVIDGNLVTGSGWGAQVAFLRALIGALGVDRNRVRETAARNAALVLGGEL